MNVDVDECRIQREETLELTLKRRQYHVILPGGYPLVEGPPKAKEGLASRLFDYLTSLPSGLAYTTFLL